MRIYDISIPIHSNMIVYPGDPPPVQKWVRLMRDGATCNLSALSLGSHTGTHVDAPYHFCPEGARLDQLPLERFIGPARVIEIRDPEAIRAEELRQHHIQPGARVLFKTRNSSLWRDPSFHRDAVYIAPDAAEHLVAVGVGLVGIDYLSVDPCHSATHPAHHTLLSKGIIILEGLDLSGVHAGDYQLIALPLKIVGAEACPIRALLMREQ